MDDKSSTLTTIQRLRALMQLANVPLFNRRQLEEPYLLDFERSSDGLSSPIWRKRLSWLGFDKHPAAVRHDYDYRIGTRRITADRSFFVNLKRLGMEAPRAFVMYRAVRWLGWCSWLRHAWNRRTRPGYAAPPWP